VDQFMRKREPPVRPALSSPHTDLEMPGVIDGSAPSHAQGCVFDYSTANRLEDRFDLDRQIWQRTN
jgi:hypothetical protein